MDKTCNIHTLFTLFAPSLKVHVRFVVYTAPQREASGGLLERSALLTFDDKEEEALIEVKHLTKRYGGHTAVSDLSFEIDKGVIYGFLGPNGAGKSTTMNIITGCLGATEGEVLVDGHSVSEEPMEAKKRIGYLPELPPLYTDMTPEEYLRFVAEAKGVSRKEQAEQIAAIMEKTGITQVSHRLIRNLSKGYRQRVGIAQALLGKPEVIILDEPTVGLDPAQIIEIRDLIRELGKEHTIVLSSHILSEVQAVCDSIMIISGGKLVASDTTENLTRRFAGTQTLCLEAEADEKTMRKALDRVEGIASVEVKPEEKENTVLLVKAEEDKDIRAKVFKAFAKENVTLLEMTTVHADLEDVFLELTQNDAPAQSEAASQAPDTTEEEETGEEEAQ